MTTAQLEIDIFHTLERHDVVRMDRGVSRQVKFRSSGGASATCANVARHFLFRPYAAWFVGAHEICVANQHSCPSSLLSASKGLRYEHYDHSSTYARSDRTANRTSTRGRTLATAGKHRRTATSHALPAPGRAALHGGRT